MDITVLYEDSEIIICEKPPGVLSQSDRGTNLDMVNRLKSYCREKNPQGGIPYIGLVHRLDRPVGGIMVFAKTPEAAKNLSEQVREHQIEKSYFVILTKDLSSEINSGKTLLENYLVKDSKSNLSKIAIKEDKDAKKASLYYTVLKVMENPEDNGKKLSLVQIDLLTGRHHQIRVQMAAQKGGVWGDTKYNPIYQNKKEWFPIGLYAYRLKLRHPQTEEVLEFQKFPTHKPFNWFK